MPRLLNQFQGWSEQGSEPVVTQTVPSTTLVQRSFPGCLATVYLAGTTTLAAIYADNSGLTPKANPFQSSVHNGYWFFYGDQPNYDVTFSGTGISQPFTIAVGYIGNTVAQYQSPWVTDIDGAGHSLLNAKRIYAVGPGTASYEIVPGSIRVVSDGVAPLIIYNPANGIDWRIDENGNLECLSERAIFGPSSFQMIYQAIKYAGIDPNFGGLIVGASKGLNWTPTEDWSLGAVDVRLGRYGPNRLMISEPVSGVMGDLFLGGVYAERGYFLGAAQGFRVVIDGAGNAGLNHVNATDVDAVSLTATHVTVSGDIIMRGGTFLAQDATGAVNGASIDKNGNISAKSVVVASNIQAEGTINAKNYMGVLGTDGIARAVLWQSSLAFAAAGIIRWAQSDTFYDVADLQLARAGAGVLTLTNPATGTAANLNLGTLAATGPVYAASFNIPNVGNGLTQDIVIGGGTLIVRGGLIVGTA